MCASPTARRPRSRAKHWNSDCGPSKRPRTFRARFERKRPQVTDTTASPPSRIRFSPQVSVRKRQNTNTVLFSPLASCRIRHPTLTHSVTNPDTGTVHREKRFLFRSFPDFSIPLPGESQPGNRDIRTLLELSNNKIALCEGRKPSVADPQPDRLRSQFAEQTRSAHTQQKNALTTDRPIDGQTGDTTCRKAPPGPLLPTFPHAIAFCPLTIPAKAYPDETDIRRLRVSRRKPHPARTPLPVGLRQRTAVGPRRLPDPNFRSTTKMRVPTMKQTGLTCFLRTSFPDGTARQSREPLPDTKKGVRKTGRPLSFGRSRTQSAPGEPIVLF